ncbi:MAG: glycoside hydrolase family 2 TIM barrel-domain containing protein [Alphaproteobacteria bacterium]
MNNKQNLSLGWYYTATTQKEWLSQLNNKAKPITLPHNNKDLPYNYFQEEEFQFVSTYQRILNLSDNEIGDNQISLLFEGVMCKADVYLNGKLITSHKGGYSEFTADLTADFIAGEDNLLTIIVDSTERNDTPPFGRFIDYITYGGIYREVFLILQPKLNIANAHISTSGYDTEEKSIQARIFIDNKQKKQGQYHIIHNLYADGYQFNGQSTITLSGQEKEEHVIEIHNIPKITLWDIDEPQLYHLELSLKNQGDIIHQYQTRIGFRQVEFTTHGFYLNGRKLKLMGLNRHQSYPYVGYAMGKRAQRADADILKNQLKLNIVRTSHYMQSKYFIDRCDELGLLVFEEIPGWQHIGDEKWKQQSLHDVEAMIDRDFNHPSIILWGVRINESADDDDFYKRTNALAHKLDPTRQTGGVRCITDSRMFEDVYTMNDFIHNGSQIALRGQQQVTGLTHKVPYMVTEYNGHMFPTKRIDPEERLMEHALRHLHVIDAMYGDDDIIGCIGWCAFDYNTHKDFGAGDHICYHGVMDMFRIPKPAAYAYASQTSPDDEAILEPVTVWARGERDECNFTPLLILTNCDYVEFYFGDMFVGRYFPARDQFKNLPHAPIIIPQFDDGGWGFNWNEGHFKGYVQGKKVAEKRFTASATPQKFTLTADDTQLHALPIDNTRIIAHICDEYGNDLPFLHTPIEFSVEGPAKILGPKVKSMLGGYGAIWLETFGEKGEVKVKAQLAELGLSQEITIKIT